MALEEVRAGRAVRERAERRRLGLGVLMVWQFVGWLDS